MPQNNQLAVDAITAFGHLTSLKLEKAFYSSKAKGKADTEHGTIVLAKVTEGPILPGEKITLEGPYGKKFIDQITCIEINKKEVKFADTSAEIGICLLKAKLTDLEKLLN
jgi:hypothetical protein